jgi:hypothetical protein
MSKPKLKSILGFALLAALSAPAIGAQTRMKAGQWENTSTREGQTSTHTICLTQATADTINGSPALIRTQFENAAAKDGACKITDLKVEASSVTSTMACGTTSLTNVMIFHGGETAENTMTTHADGKEYVATMKMKRLGACPANSK